MIIETEKEFNSIFLPTVEESNELYISVIFQDRRLHPAVNKVSFVYVRLIDVNESFYLIFKHNDSLSLKRKCINKLESICIDKDVYVLDKKRTLHALNLENCIDIEMLFFIEANMDINTILKSKLDSNFIIQEYASMFRKMHKLNKCIPLMKLIEFQDEKYNKLKGVISKLKHLKDNDAFNYLNNIALNDFAKIEDSGLHIDIEKFVKHYPDYNKKHIKDDKIYSEYNFLTATGRPSNRYDKVNFNALNKEDGTREIFTSRFSDGYLLNVDYDAYHIRLVGSLIGYDFPSNKSVHEYFGKRYYFKTDELTDEQYEDSKSMSFFKMYGHNQNENIPFFKQLIEYKRDLWEKFKDNGCIETCLFEREIKASMFSEDDNINMDKLFNYYIQSFETERNIIIINQILELLKDYKTKLILYTYDSFLFDYNNNDGDELLNKLTKVISNETFYVKIETGKNYHNMTKLES